MEGQDESHCGPPEGQEHAVQRPEIDVARLGESIVSTAQILEDLQKEVARLRNAQSAAPPAAKVLSKDYLNHQHKVNRKALDALDNAIASTDELACRSSIADARAILQQRQSDLEMEDENGGFLNWAEDYRKLKELKKNTQGDDSYKAFFEWKATQKKSAADDQRPAKQPFSAGGARRKRDLGAAGFSTSAPAFTYGPGQFQQATFWPNQAPFVAGSGWSAGPRGPKGPVQCYACFQFGHTQHQCRNQGPSAATSGAFPKPITSVRHQGPTQRF